MAWAGQRDTLKIPKADTVLYLHAVRPIFQRAGQNAIVFFHDTIPIRWDERWERRITWRAFFTVSARTADKILVQSSSTQLSVKRDLGASVDHVLSLPSDSERATYIKTLRAELTVDPLTMLYVGRIRPHKNIVRALMAFAGSDFKRTGGKFILVGADQHGQESIKNTLRQINSDQITVLPYCSNEELDRIYATAGFLIQPSLEEGYGLPIIEALNVGMPVCCSDLKPMSEVANGQAELFDPWSIFSISEAIDRTAKRAVEGFVPDPPHTPTPREFAEEILSILNLT